jgi:hypothetical protein
LNLSLRLERLLKDRAVSRFRIFSRTSVCPPRAVGVFTSASRHAYGVFSNSNTLFRFTLIASISAAIHLPRFPPKYSGCSSIQHL